MSALRGKVAVVAGASRGAGRGIALALGDAGATVYVAGRTSRNGPKPADGAPGTVEETAEQVMARGGKGIPVLVDCTKEREVAALFERVQQEQGRLDLLANAVWGGGDAYTSTEEWLASMGQPFWEQPSHWQYMMNAGPYAYFLASCYAARLMAAHGSGLIVGITDGVIDGMNPNEGSGGPLVWELAHQCINRLMQGIAQEGKARGIAAITLMPGFMQTERVLRAMKTEELKKMFRFDKSESVEYLGRAVAALAADPQVMDKSGRLLFVGDLAKEYGFTDVDGRYIPKFNPFDEVGHDASGKK
jgi:NAD(P)-dependent dehydrogenase (short-subunit alcohol dehydrogenase family)